LLSTFIAYYVAKGKHYLSSFYHNLNIYFFKLILGHRPRYLALSIVFVVLYCFITSAPHFLFGPGEDAIALTEEFGAVANHEQSLAMQLKKEKKSMCNINCKAGIWQAFGRHF
jgi:Organic Anion Transporter Polypeptide (OATP) family